MELIMCQKYLKPFKVEFDPEALRSESREENLVFARALCSFILREKGFRFVHVGKIINRSHGAIVLLLQTYTSRKHHIRNGNAQRFEFITKELKVKLAKEPTENLIDYHLKELRKLRKHIA